MTTSTSMSRRRWPNLDDESRLAAAEADVLVCRVDEQGLGVATAAMATRRRSTAAIALALDASPCSSCCACCACCCSRTVVVISSWMPFDWMDAWASRSGGGFYYLLLEGGEGALRLGDLLGEVGIRCRRRALRRRRGAAPHLA